MIIIFDRVIHNSNSFADLDYEEKKELFIKSTKHIKTKAEVTISGSSDDKVHFDINCNDTSVETEIKQIIKDLSF
jgi:hypothetical protein